MSTSKQPGLVDAKEQSAYERWELPNMGGPSSSEVSAEDIQPITAEQIEEIQQQARSEGFELGRREGLQAARSEIDASLMRFEQIIRSLANPLQVVNEQVESELVQLSMAIAKQIVRRELQTQPEQVIGVVRDALAALPVAARDIKIHLNPEDALLVREHLATTDDHEAPWKLVDDLTLTKGGCRIESATSSIDASVEKRLNAVISELLGGTRSVDDDA